MRLGTKIWNALPEKIKSETSYKKFKEYIDLWFGPKFRCNICNPFAIEYFIKLLP